MKQKLSILSVLICLISLSCRKESIPSDINVPTQLKIAVVSDIHYMDPSLIANNGAAGAAFQNYVNDDPKLLEYSAPIFVAVLAQLKSEKPDILLVPGDLTKDGEKVGHTAIADYLNQLRSNGTKVYLMPGNHDINNAKAKKYDGARAYAVDKTTKTDFETIYANFGYNDAIERDPNSLSYIAQPYDDLWIIAIDASRYEEYGSSGDFAAGRIKPATLTWILNKLAEAKQKNITVFAMMHHNLIEHYSGQAQLKPGYVVEDWQNVANRLSDAGLKFLFSGHSHANDITSYVHNGKELFDIETGSLVTPPSPYRIIVMKDKKLQITTNTVQTIGANLPGGISFPAYSNQFLSQHLDSVFYDLLTNQFGATPQLATFATPLFRNAFMAHWAGDENMPLDQRQKIEQLKNMSPPLAAVVTTFWTDLGVADNNTTLNMQ